jgi:hypothetical protein
MKFLTYLQEEWATGEDEEVIYINPSAKEVTLTGKLSDGYVRFIADFKNKNLYIFSSWMYHSRAEFKLTHLEDDTIYATGVAKTVNGKLHFYRSDVGTFWMQSRKDLKFVESWKWPKMDDSWLNRWFGPHFIKHYLDISMNKDPEWK